MNSSIADIRKEYSSRTLLESDAHKNPFDQFHEWWKQAIAAELLEPNAMTLATSSSTGDPDARIVLLKDVDEGGLMFFTNYESAKGKELDSNPKACLVFFWKELERQVRIKGAVSKLSAAKSDEYFFSRPKGSQIGAWASPQSQKIVKRNWLDDRYTSFEKKFSGEPLTRPPYWGGFLLVPHSFEFWQGRPSRLHDRLLYTSTGSEWKIERLAP